MTEQFCPCGNLVNDKRLAYSKCCESLHLGVAKATSPEHLMRSRYSAFYLGLADYVFTTHHPDFRADASIEDYRQTILGTNWCQLEVIMSSQEAASGIVEFKAYFIDKEKLHCLHEVSNFLLQDGQWFYTDGDYRPKQVSKINRNDSCPCQSGLKAKKCCLK